MQIGNINNSFSIYGSSWNLSTKVNMTILHNLVLLYICLYLTLLEKLGVETDFIQSLMSSLETDISLFSSLVTMQ